MAGSLIGALRVSLGLDSAQFTEGVKKARRDADQGSKSIAQSLAGINNMAKLAGAAIAAAVSATVVVAVRDAANAMDDLSKSAQKTGTSATELSKLRWAADLSAVSAEGLDKALIRLNVGLSEMTGKGSEASRALRAMGVTAGQTTLQAMEQIAEEFANMPDGVEKTTLAYRAFGKAGADLIPLLNGGREGLRDAAAEAERLGLVIDGNTARAAEAFNDNLSRLGKVTQGITTQMTAGLVQTLAAVTDELAGGVRTGALWVQTGRDIGSGLLWVAEMAAITAESIRGVVNAVISVKDAAVAFSQGKIYTAGRLVADQERRTAEGIKAREAAFARMRESIANFEPGEIKRIPGVAELNELTTSGKKGKLKVDVDFVAPNDRGGWALKALLDQGTTPEIDLKNKALQGIAETMRELQGMDFSMEIYRPEALQAAERFAEGLSQNLSQAIVFGQSLGDALVNSIKAAAAELVTSGLLDFLLGGKGAGGGRSGGIVGAILGIPGFADGTNFAPGGLAMVGERGRELVQLPRGSRVIPNGQTEAMMAKGAGGGRVEVALAPGLVASMVEGAVTVAQRTAGEQIRQATRPRMLSSRGA
ncbi:MAG: hypothetical protein MUE77_05295 [Sandarakinorhabdus sp.]|jgi:hypothetical protein|nr:hypothetical protein [Sandarakinorhabdus sp.]